MRRSFYALDAWQIAALAFVVVAAALWFASDSRPAHALAAELLVTSSADGGDIEPVCPSDDACTLREAIETANQAEGEGDVRILFDPAAFPADPPAVIAVTGAALPVVSRDRITIDGSDATVVIDGSELDGGDGLRISGDGATVRAVHLRNFGGACLRTSGPGASVGGDRTAGGAIRLGNCAIGLVLEAENAVVRGAVIGFAADGHTAAPVGTGIEVRASGVAIGGIALASELATVVGNADRAVRLDTSPIPLSNVMLGGNIFGLAEDGTPAPVAVGVEVSAGATDVIVAENIFAGMTVAAISLPAAAEGGAESARIAITANQYVGLEGLAIDLGGDGVRNDNDLDDADTGPNTALNHPRVTRPTQSTIDGIACADCRIELYRAVHEPGGLTDFASELLDTTTAGSNGAFSFTSPPVEPGGWITATATDEEGNTSEFSPSARVGVGAIQCGNIALATGWNLAGYFGASTLQLGEDFPGDTTGRIRAIYELGPGGEFLHWFRDTPVGRTLTSLVPGRAYWFLLDGPLGMPEGFSLTSPLGVQLNAGWNTFVYFGGDGDVRDAFSSLLDKALEVYQFAASPGPGHWNAWGTESTPPWARAFSEVEACEAYVVYVDEAAILNPLHP